MDDKNEMVRYVEIEEGILRDMLECLNQTPQTTEVAVIAMYLEKVLTHMEKD